MIYCKEKMQNKISKKEYSVTFQGSSLRRVVKNLKPNSPATISDNMYEMLPERKLIKNPLPRGFYFALLLFCFVFAFLGVETRTVQMLNKHSTVRPHPQYCAYSFH